MWRLLDETYLQHFADARQAWNDVECHEDIEPSGARAAAVLTRIDVALILGRVRAIERVLGWLTLGVWVLVILGAIALFKPAAAQATAFELEQHCLAVDRIIEGRWASDSDPMEASYCQGFLAGYLDTLSLAEFWLDQEIVCLPESGIPNDQIRRVFLKFIKEQPEDLDASARLILTEALAEAFPCD